LTSVPTCENVGTNRINDDAAVLIAGSLPNLKLLNLNENEVGTLGAVALCRKLQHLNEMFISDSPIGLEGAIAIARLQPNLKRIDIGSWFGLFSEHLRDLSWGSHAGDKSSVGSPLPTEL